MPGNVTYNIHSKEISQFGKERDNSISNFCPIQMNGWYKIECD